MTGDEMERAIEFLLKHQANFESRQATLETQLEKTSHQVEDTNKRLEDTNKRLEIHAETQTEFMRIVTQHIEAQGKINASLRALLARTDERVDKLADTIERFISGQTRP